MFTPFNLTRRRPAQHLSHNVTVKQPKFDQLSSHYLSPYDARKAEEAERAYGCRGWTASKVFVGRWGSRKIFWLALMMT